LLSITLAGYAQRRRMLNQKAVVRSQSTPATTTDPQQKTITPGNSL